MFKGFFSDHKDAWLYSQVCVILRRDFGVDIKTLENLSGENLVRHCGDCRREGLNAESTAMLLLSSAFCFMRDYPSLNTGIAINEDGWTAQAVKFGETGLVALEGVHNFLECLEQAVISLGYSAGLLKLAHAGNPQAQKQLGLCYGSGKGVAHDDVEAAHWIRKAAEQNLKEAQLLMGEFYDSGRGVPQDGKIAMSWYKRVAEQGCVATQNLIGERYADGDGVPEDMTEAVRWWRIAAGNGFAESQYHLGTSLLAGTGIAKDEIEGVKWLHKAAEQDHTDAQRTLCGIYSDGVVVPKDLAESRKWFSRSCKLWK
jgi:hypothetical protein